MGMVTLPSPRFDTDRLINEKDDQVQIRELIVTLDRQLVPTIRFEAPKGSYRSSSLLILNNEDHVERIGDRSLQREIFRLHGIPVATNTTKFIREYMLCVFQTRAILIYGSLDSAAWTNPSQQPKSKNKFRRIALDHPGKEVKKVQTLAIRALYAAGLDYGVVRCGIGSGRNIVVTQINVSPRLNDEMEEEFVQAVLKYSREIYGKRVPMKDIVLGADPEFAIQSPKGHLLIASNYFPVHGRVGCDAIWIGQNRSQKPLVEIRPEPTKNPREIVLRIYRGLLHAAKQLELVPSIWLAGAMPHKGFPLGGHIHFSGIRPDFKMLRAFDNYLSFPLVMVEDKRGCTRRPKYGFLGDFRYQPHGGFEYRTPPSWLVSPTLTKGVFSIAKVIAANYHQLKYDPLSDVELQKAYYEGEKETIRGWVEVLFNDLRGLEDYREYENYLERFFQYITSGVQWDESRDFRKNWKIPPYHTNL